MEHKTVALSGNQTTAHIGEEMIDSPKFGSLPLRFLEKNEMNYETENEKTHIIEYYFMGQLARKDVHVQLKKSLSSDIEAALFK